MYDVEPSFGRLCSLIMAFGGLLFVLDAFGRAARTRQKRGRRQRSVRLEVVLFACARSTAFPIQPVSYGRMIERRAPEVPLLPDPSRPSARDHRTSRMCRDAFQQKHPCQEHSIECSIPGGRNICAIPGGRNVCAYDGCEWLGSMALLNLWRLCRPSWCARRRGFSSLRGVDRSIGRRRPVG